MLLKQTEDFWISTKYDHNEGLDDLIKFIKKKNLKIDPKWLKRAFNWIKCIENYACSTYERVTTLKGLMHLKSTWIEQQIKAILRSFPETWWIYYQSEDFVEGYNLICLTDREKVRFT